MAIKKVPVEIKQRGKEKIITPVYEGAYRVISIDEKEATIETIEEVSEEEMTTNLNKLAKLTKQIEQLLNYAKRQGWIKA